MTASRCFHRLTPPSSLPLEPHGPIALHILYDDLKSYSLASRALNEEVNLVLWRSVAVAPREISPEGIEAFVNAGPPAGGQHSCHQV